MYAILYYNDNIWIILKVILVVRLGCSKKHEANEFDSKMIFRTCSSFEGVQNYIVNKIKQVLNLIYILNEKLDEIATN